MGPGIDIVQFVSNVRALFLSHKVRHNEGGDDELTSFVLKSLFDAGTMLAAIADDTPLAKTYEEVLALLSGQAGAAFDWNGQNLTGTGTIRADSAKWWREHHIPGSSASPGASGATWNDPDANGPGGWGLDNVNEQVIFQGHVESDWDAASNLKAEVYFQYDDANEVGDGGLVTDELVLDLVAYYMKPGDTAIKTQSFSDTVVIGQSPRYKMFEAEFDLTYNPGGGNDFADEDVIGFIVNLDIPSSTVTGGTAKIIANIMEFKYKTAWVAYEI